MTKRELTPGEKRWNTFKATCVAIFIGINYLPSDWKGVAIVIIAILLSLVMVIGIFFDENQTRQHFYPRGPKY
jgi:hypothetical protein